MLLRALLFAVLALGACTPLIRFGEIEPPDGTKALIDVEVKPQNRPGLTPEELAAAVSDAGIGVLATQQMPIVGAGDVVNEIASNVQGGSVTAKDAVVDEALLATDARRLESIYMARGYFRAKNTGHHIIGRGDDRAIVSFDMIEGSETTISEIRFRGACEVKDDPDAEKLKRLRLLCRETRELLPMLVGDIWTEEAYANGLDILSRAFRAAGFLHARVAGDNWVSRDRGIAAIWYDIDSGPLVRVMGDVVIEGNVHVDVERIRDRIEIKEGDILDSALLRGTERNIQDLGPFFSVQAAVIREAPVGDSTETPRAPTVPVDTLAPESPGTANGELPDNPVPSPAVTPDANPDEPAPEVIGDEEPKPPPEEVRPPPPDKMRVKVQVAEAPRWELTIGPSIVTDFSRLEFGLPAAFTHRNLFGSVIALQAAARPALVFPDCFTGDAACFTTPKFGLDAKLGLQVPSFFEEYLRLSVDANYKRDPSQSVASEEIGGSIGLSRRIVQGLTARIGYNLAFYNYFASTALANLTVVDEAALIEDAALRFKTQDVLAWFDVALVLDLRDSPLDARNGLFASFSMNLSGDYSGSAVPYVRMIGDVRGYWTPRFLKWLTLAARINVGGNLFEVGEGTPQPARFKSGGATSMRGFGTDRVGDFVCKDADAQKNYLNVPECGSESTDRTYIGGNYIIESNFELRFHLRGGLGLVAFLDAGRVWSTGGLQIDDLFVAIGPGFRYDLPVGPIRFDIGFLLGRNRATEFHFSLGQAF